MRLKYAIFSHKGGALLVSDTAGNGKTSILARLQNDLKDYYGGRVRVAYIDHPTLTPPSRCSARSPVSSAENSTHRKRSAR